MIRVTRMNTRMAKPQQGFTLIELMIVVAIIAILASLAISVYQTYTVRAQVSEGVNMAASAKTPVIDTFLQSGRPPEDREAAGMSALATDTKGKYVASVDIVDGRVDVTYGNDAHAQISGQTVSFTPYMTASGITIVWRCGNAPAPAAAAALAGGGTTSTHQAPTVNERYLPRTCRN